MWTSEAEAALATIEKTLNRSRAWHDRHRDAIIAIGAVARTISLAYGKEAGDLAYNTGLMDLRARDPENGTKNDL